MREIVLGTAGHVDHGKTSFIRALTGFFSEARRFKRALPMKPPDPVTHIAISLSR